MTSHVLGLSVHIGLGLVVSARAVVSSFALGEIWKPRHAPARIVAAQRIPNYAPIRTLGRERVSSCENIHRAATKLEPHDLAVRVGILFSRSSPVVNRPALVLEE